VLLNRNFSLLLGARSISYFGTYLAPIAVAFAVLDLTGSASETGIAFACWTVAQVSTLVIGGVVSEAALAGGGLIHVAMPKAPRHGRLKANANHQGARERRSRAFPAKRRSPLTRPR
jgi:Na+/glutamate symporter